MSVKNHINIISLIQAGFSIVLASLYALFCTMPSVVWIVIAIPASFWFYLILPVLLLIALVTSLYKAIRYKSFSKYTAIYFGLSLVSFFIFGYAVNTGCYLSA